MLWSSKRPPTMSHSTLSAKRLESSRLGSMARTVAVSGNHRAIAPCPGLKRLIAWAHIGKLDHFQANRLRGGEVILPLSPTRPAALALLSGAVIQADRLIPPRQYLGRCPIRFLTAGAFALHARRVVVGLFVGIDKRLSEPSRLFTQGQVFGSACPARYPAGEGKAFPVGTNGEVPENRVTGLTGTINPAFLLNAGNRLARHSQVDQDALLATLSIVDGDALAHRIPLGHNQRWGAGLGRVELILHPHSLFGAYVPVVHEGTRELPGERFDGGRVPSKSIHQIRELIGERIIDGQLLVLEALAQVPPKWVDRPALLEVVHHNDLAPHIQVTLNVILGQIRFDRLEKIHSVVVAEIILAQDFILYARVGLQN